MFVLKHFFLLSKTLFRFQYRNLKYVSKSVKYNNIWQHKFKIDIWKNNGNMENKCIKSVNKCKLINVILATSHIIILENKNKKND